MPRKKPEELKSGGAAPAPKAATPAPAPAPTPTPAAAPAARRPGACAAQRSHRAATIHTPE